MALKKGKSKKTIASNIRELLRSAMGKIRGKAVKTIAEKEDIPVVEAKRKQAVAIALSKARESGAKIPVRATRKKMRATKKKQPTVRARRKLIIAIKK